MAICGISLEPEVTIAFPAPTEKEQSNPIALDPTPTPKIVLSLPVPQSSNDDNKPIKYTNDIVPSLKTGYPSRYEFTIVENDGIESIIPYIKTIGAANSEINGCQLTWVSPPSESYEDTEARFKLRCIPLYEGFHSYHILISDKKETSLSLAMNKSLEIHVHLDGIVTISGLTLVPILREQTEFATLILHRLFLLPSYWKT